MSHLNSTVYNINVACMFLSLWSCMCNVDASNGLYDFIGYRTPPCKSYCLATLFVILLSSYKVFIIKFAEKVIYNKNV